MSMLDLLKRNLKFRNERTKVAACIAQWPIAGVLFHRAESLHSGVYPDGKDGSALSCQMYCNICEMLICKLVHLFIVFGEYGRYIGNINHLW